MRVDHVGSLTSAKKSTNFAGHQEQEDEQEEERKERKRNDNNDKHMDKDKDVMNDSHISSNYLPSFLAHRKFLSGHNSAKVTYLCKFCRHQCIQGCKYSCACKKQWYCCRGSSRDKRVVKRCIHHRLEKVAVTKSKDDEEDKEEKDKQEEEEE